MQSPQRPPCSFKASCSKAREVCNACQAMRFLMPRFIGYCGKGSAQNTQLTPSSCLTPITDITRKTRDFCTLADINTSQAQQTPKLFFLPLRGITMTKIQQYSLGNLSQKALLWSCLEIVQKPHCDRLWERAAEQGGYPCMASKAKPRLPEHKNQYHSYTGAIFFCPAIPTICRWHFKGWNSSTRCTVPDPAADWTMQVHPQQRAWFANTALIPPSRVRSSQDTRASPSSITNTTWVTAKLISHNKTMWSACHAATTWRLQAFWWGVKFNKLL